MHERPARPGTAAARAVRRRAAPVVAAIMVMLCGQAAGAPVATPCGDAIAVLNEGKAWEAFDRDSGGGGKRLRFRLDGWEVCPSGTCTAGHDLGAPPKPDAAPEAKPATSPDGPDGAASTRKPDAKADPAPEAKVATRIDIVATGAAGDKVVATVDIKGRSVSYCFLGASRVDAKPDPHRTGCPGSYLRNFLQIRLVDSDGPFARRDVDIDYLYRPDTVAISLDRCSPPRILDGMFRRRAWTVTLEDGAAVHIGETNFPRDRRAPVPQDAPFATTVPGAAPQ